ncbi:SixA phosphatase family protein [Abyssalbus ytuae]|uniref:Histidine phosphatase family protein n=1 Tax=Abyssalbus ytuae TaxID=2926907 RepID=A0A9E7D1L2_9FLAO|nr:histidine phosphatase family protein [Abyssalbus ytuae]UOB17228.1 histidine phosphatase family protein [Abyssalbus ytuae]
MSNKLLTIVRHAKSSWEHDVTDKERPLAKRGIKDANLISRYLFKNGVIIPETVFSSPANRALTTCKIFMENFNFPLNKIRIEDELYDFSGDSVIKFITSLNNNYDNVMIFGHNHAFTSISNIFGDKFIDNLPTSGVVMINFESDNWKNIEKGKTKLTLFPKQLKK